MDAREALSKISFQLVEQQGSISGTAAPIGRQADRIIAELGAAGYRLVKFTKSEPVMDVSE